MHGEVMCGRGRYVRRRGRWCVWGGEKVYVYGEGEGVSVWEGGRCMCVGREKVHVCRKKG